MCIKKHLPLHCFIIVLFLLFTSCEEEDHYQVREFTPEYVTPATIYLADLRQQGDLTNYQSYLDSIYAKYRDKSVIDNFYVWYLYADSYGRIGKPHDAAKYTDSILHLMEENKQSNFSRNNYLWVYYFKADYEMRNGNLDEAYKYYYQALSFAEGYHDTCAVGYYYLKIGLLMFDARQYKDAKAYFTKAYDYCGSCEDYFGYFFRTQQLLNDIGLCYERTEQYDSAISYYQKGIALIEKRKDDFPESREGLADIAVCIIKGNLGSAYLGMQQIDSAEKVLTDALSSDRYLIGEPVDVQYTKLKLAQVYLKKGKLSDADMLLSSVYSFIDSLGDQRLFARYYKLRWKYWEQRQDLAKAYKYLKEYKDAEDSFKDGQFNFSMLSLDNKVKNLGNQYRISLLEQDAETKKMYLLTLIVIALFAIVIVVQGRNNLKRSRNHVKELRYMNNKIEQQSARLKTVLKELEAAGGEKDRILKAVSHDMRSPVNSVLALIDLLKADKNNLSEEQVEYIELMEKSGQNALNLTKDLLEVATLTPDSLEKEPVDITSEIGGRIKLLQFKAGEKNQNIVFNAPANHITANVNSEKLLRVLSNLVGNAIKFSPEGVDVNVKLSLSGDAFKLEVEDSGIGIPESMKAKVFDVFSEAKRFGTGGEQPYGLGLSISKQIVEAHNGTIWFESEDGKGTRFFVEIPV